MKRRRFLVFVCGGLVATAAGPADAQQVGKLRLGVISQGRLEGWPFTGLLKGLTDLGYREPGLSIHHARIIDYSKLEPLAREMVDDKPDVVVAYGATAARAVLAVTAATPVIVVSGSDPVEAGLTTSFARPSRNVTGFVGATPEMQGKRIELLRDALPSAKRVGVMFDPTTVNERRLVDQAADAAGRAGLELLPVEVRSSDDFSAALTKLRSFGADALLTGPSAILSIHARTLGETVTRQRLPALFHSREFVLGGGLLSFGANTYETFRQVAGYVDRIASGTRITDLPFQRPEHVELVVNARAARDLGVHLSPAFLARASDIVE